MYSATIIAPASRERRGPHEQVGAGVSVQLQRTQRGSEHAAHQVFLIYEHGQGFPYAGLVE